MAINLNHLKFALKVAQTGSFTAASRLCFVTQPTLSNGVQHLENELGGKLFERTTRRVKLTPFGSHMLPAIEEMLNVHQELKDSAVRYLQPEHKLLAIGFSPLADMRIISALVDPFTAERSDVKTYFKECYIGGLIDRLDDGQIALGIRPVPVTAEDERTAPGACKFYREPVFVIPRDSSACRISGTGPVTVDAIADETFVLTPDLCGHAHATRNWFKMRGKRIVEYPGQAVSYQVMQDWASLGLASAILPWSKISESNRWHARPLMLDEDTPAHIEFELIWKRSLDNTDPLTPFLKHCEDRLASLIAGLHIPGEMFAEVEASDRST